MKDVKILIIDTIHKDILDNYHKKYEIAYYPNIIPSHLVEVIEKYNILIISTRIPITRDIINKAINLKLIVRMGIGVDHIDLNACKEHCITVCNTPNSNIEPVVEYVFGQILRNYRNFESMNDNMLQGKFRNELQMGEELSGKTIGVIGVGRIGSHICRTAKIFGMKVIANDPYLTKSQRKKLYVDKWVDKSKLLNQSDIVTLHVPLTTETEYMVNKEFLENMKYGAILINTSRGKVAVFKDIIEFAKTARIKKFILDVYEEEPFTPNIDKDIIKYFYFSPHTGSFTKQSLINRSIEAFDEVIEFIKDKKPHGKINFKRGY